MFIDQLRFKEIAWEAAIIVDGHDSSVIRKDACGAWIQYVEFNNKDSEYGWVIDHVYPIIKLRALNVSEYLWDNPLNIRALHWKNDWSKANSYPKYTSVISAVGEINIEYQRTFWVSDVLQHSLRKLFIIEE